MRNISASSAIFYSTVPIFPQPSSPIFHTQYQLLRVGPMSHTLSLIYPTPSSSLPSPLSPPYYSGAGAQPTTSLTTAQGAKAARVLPPRRRSSMRLLSPHPPPLSSALLPASDLGRRCWVEERSRKAAQSRARHGSKAARRLCAARGATNAELGNGAGARSSGAGWSALCSARAMAEAALRIHGLSAPWDGAASLPLYPFPRS
jgi:hypothetical protein